MVERTSELVARAANGDAKAWSRLYQTHFDALFRDVMYLANSSTLAEEIVQETFAAALTSLRRFHGRSSFQTWLGGIARNLVHKHWRSHVRRQRAYDRLEPRRSTDPLVTNRDGNPEEGHLQRQRATVLKAVLAELSPALREVFILRDVQGLDVDDVAHRLEITPTNVRVRATRARAAIRDQLTELGWIQPEAEK